MQEMDKISGLPKDLFDISNIAKEQQKIKVEVIRRKFSKFVMSLAILVLLLMLIMPFATALNFKLNATLYIFFSLWQ